MSTETSTTIAATSVGTLIYAVPDNAERCSRPRTLTRPGRLT
jgi:hypothetical protein